MAATSAAAHNPPLLTSPPPFSWAAVVSGQVAGAPLSPRSKSKSFHDVLVNNGPVKQKAPSTFRGEPAAFFSKEEISKLAAPFRYTLVGKFSYKRPKMEIIRKFFHSLDLKSLQSVGLLHENHIVIFITQEEDYTRLLMRAVWYIADAPMKILKWSPEFYPNVESPVVPVWVGLPGLPLHFFEKSALFYIASAFGTPLKVDEPTVNLTRPTVARVCIKVDVSKPRNQRLWVGDDKEGFWQEVVFENPPPYCDFCKMLGHEVSVCSRKNPSLKTETKKVHHSKDTMLEENKTVDATQKFKENENRNETRKKKEALHSLVDNQNGNEWVVVGKKHKPKVTATQAVVVPTLAASEKESLKESEKTNERTAEQMETRDSRASVNPKKILQTAVEGKAGDRPIAVPVIVPPLLRQHLSSSCIALTPFPDLAKIKQGKGVKDGTGETSEPSFMKNKDPTGAVPIIPSVEDPQKPSSRLKLHEMGKDLQAMSSSPSSVNSSVDGRPEKVIAYLQQVVRGIQGEPSDQNVSQGLELMLISDQPQDDNTAGQLELQQTLDADFDTAAAHVNAAEEVSDLLQKEKNESKIKPLDCPINSQPSVVSATKCKNSEMGCQLGMEKSNGLSTHSIKGFGNLASSFLKIPTQLTLNQLGLIHAGWTRMQGQNLGSINRAFPQQQA